MDVTGRNVSFEVIAYGMHGELEWLELYKHIDNESKREASGLLQCITTFDFIINFITLYMALSQLDGISKKKKKKKSLQEIELDKFGVHQKVDNLV